MSKNTLRFAESAIVGGRLGTARIRGEIASAAAHLESPALPPLAPELASMVGDARAVHRQLGRMGGGKMNKSEAAYAQYLEALKSVGKVLWFRFEGIKLRLADNTFYTPDFAVIVASGALELHEFKGFMEEDANVKLKAAAAQYPFAFRLVRKAKGGGFDVREV
ncbi:DUF1064 domain-containing protein [Paraburkholderia silvatlantica]|uniref:DUF1064 domain-containing protein n=1 Tax=Paraburkholderia silvatlantica TaxID=321895 RepID=A0ABR6FLQ8_9BURK|nr:DUF1064 domain-containing protein [Paraburkholderia silvatlantica]MBB2928370.1 hypothetical protein [Paraburkholderia silvatlantica]PVY34585.1 hypothetical protein C7411_107121 [Paraburkholderia silvatlantica]PXW38800.1 hypothetical protein C7413_107121 [Paraburkholderia silvatlantica]